MLVTAIGYFAEAAYHHPDLAVTWGRVIVKLKNHAAGGVTDKDFELARKIEEVVLWRPAAGRELEGTPNKVMRPRPPRGAAGHPPPGDLPAGASSPASAPPPPPPGPPAQSARP